MKQKDKQPNDDKWEGMMEKSDILKVLDVLRGNEIFHRHRDEMNSALHLAKETRFSPLTSETISARERLEFILAEIERLEKEGR